MVALQPIYDVRNRLVFGERTFANGTAPSTRPPAPLVAMPLERCRLSRLDELEWKVVQAMPSWLRALGDRVRAREAIEALGLPPTPLDAVVEALTLPSCQTGIDYERLETIGVRPRRHDEADAAGLDTQGTLCRGCRLPACAGCGRDGLRTCCS